MELAARRFAQWVLAVHLLLLVAVLAVVWIAARGVYDDARQQALEQASKRQGLLAEQTARGIEGFYKSIIETLEVLRRAQEGEAAVDQVLQPQDVITVTRQTLAPALWQQLRNRASYFMVYGRGAGRLFLAYPTNEFEKGAKIAELGRAWLANVNTPDVSSVYRTEEGQTINLVAVPMRTGGVILFVAVVPIETVDLQFLQSVHSQANMSAVLLDENLRVLIALDKSIVGKSLDQGSGGKTMQIAERYAQKRAGGTEIINETFQLGSHTFQSGMVSIQPITLLGKTWWLEIASDLAEVDSIVRGMFRRTVFWAIVLAVSMTAILASTSLLMIRSRIRMERMRHEMLEHELAQARKIQLAWLPKSHADLKHVDLSAVNQPASHISGDFYNWFNLPDGRVCVVIGDVTGHGMGAAFLMATTQLLVRMIMPHVATPGRCMREVNRQLCRQIFSGQFVTMQILAINPTEGRCEIATAGHPPPLVRFDGGFSPIKIEPQLVLGVDSSADYPTETFDLSHTGGIVLYTDGVPDAMAPDEQRFGMEGLQKSLDLDFPTAQSIADRIVAAVEGFRGTHPLVDDLTLVTIRMPSRS